VAAVGAGRFAKNIQLATGSDGWTGTVPVLAPAGQKFYAHVVMTPTISGARSRIIDR
jgi:hypothetical protein